MLETYRRNSNVKFHRIDDDILEFSIESYGMELQFQIIVNNEIHRLNLVSKEQVDRNKLNKIEDDFIENKDLTKLIVELNDFVKEWRSK